ncbi:MAG: DUF2167 domain-containing protein [Rhodopila sp.]|nr:DUF2167 domain-containing protein [Rhodopila sp.]
MHDVRASIRLTPRKSTVLRIVLATLLSGLAGFAAVAAAPDQDTAGVMFETAEQAYTSAVRQSIGAPARADLGDQATVRLADDLLIVPREPAARLLTVMERNVPSDFAALLVGAEGMEAPGFIRFVPAGFIDSDAALGWTQDDMLSSLKDTIERRNPDRVKRNLPEREVRRWIRPPEYNPETHQLSWAALIVPKSAPRESDGEITYYALGFGREGYVQLSIVTSVQKADEIGRMADSFLAGLNFVPGKAYGDVLLADRRAPDGLAGAMGVDSLHKSQLGGSFWASDTVVPLAGGIVATIGALSLFIYILRHRRREARRI